MSSENLEFELLDKRTSETLSYLPYLVKSKLHRNVDKRNLPQNSLLQSMDVVLANTEYAARKFSISAMIRD